MLANLTAFSQSVIKNTTDSIVQLPKNVAKEVVKDIMRKDSLEVELKTAKANITLLNGNIVASDSIIASKDSVIKLWVLKGNNYEAIINYQTQQKTNLEALTKSLAADLRKTKRKSTIKSIVGSAIIGTLAYLYIVK